MASFLKKLEALGSYLVEFCDDGLIEPKVCSLDYAINSLNKRSVIFIIYDKSTFLANDSQHQAWLKKSDTFLYSKEK